MLQWTYSGVDFTIKDNGGPECLVYASTAQRLYETGIIIIWVAFELHYAIYYAHTRFTDPNDTPFPAEDCEERKPSVLRRIILVVYAWLWGIEIGFKIASRQLIWILNPCHIVTLIQIILLALSSNKISRGLYRLHVVMISGGTLAMYFPLTTTRFFPFEVEIYYIQHILILIVPIFLLTSHGGYSLEPMKSFRWTILAITSFRIYHFFVLQPVSLLTSVNLNGVLCPLEFDPFNSVYYRMWANVHQSLFMLLHHKLYSLIARALLGSKYIFDIKKLLYSSTKDLSKAK
ncbi:unnamed protein product [Didymodactylos carnosus]|uniref:Transmembrane protein 164 n=1 Tax=Didymodactylos carnosus TaxID=1234261 RepID=A0A813Q220_9BILA|nr:unnamed protein product [Didymodactylos carnosus]CAF1108648.1 unnamed protein product [Didymodactylos carnosus]CAF3539409.1 unnamed protein product [Didymodactylos carnosus]CAF3874505.1 unnamed protein product [Didymodactylos carnosus]